MAVLIKKIRIHIPQKVTHIHHHKKIYITKHMAQPTQFLPQYANPEQYASGYLATSETASIAPTIAFLPIAEGRRSTAGSSPAPNLQPLYRARGHYGPPQSENEASSSNKRIKVIKISEGKKKRIIRKKRPKRIIIKAASNHKHQDDKDSNSMSAFHEEFYSDVKPNPGTFKRTRKPKRVEKYMEGDTEHIHTYSEEHIHQIVYDNPTANAQHSEVSPALLPLEGVHHHQFVPTAAIPTSAIPSALTIQGATASHLHASPSTFSLGSLGTPAHLEYMHYDPHEVTHDHIIHDHGEMIHQFPEMKIPTSPKASYNSQGIKLNPNYSEKDQPSFDGKGSWVSQDSSGKGSDNTNDFSYYENFYKPKKSKIPSYPSSVHKKPANADITPLHKFQEETQLNTDFQFEDLYSDPLKSTLSTYHGNDYKKRPKHKPHSVPNKFPKSIRQHHHHKAAENKPYTTASTFLENHSFGGFKDVKEPPALNSYKHYTSIYGSTGPFEAADAFGSSSNDHKKEKQPPAMHATHSWRNKKNKSNKSVSSQNINFGGQEHKMVINHETSIAIAGQQTLETRAGPSPATIDITYAPIDKYYNNPSYDGPSSMPDASNTNFRIVEAPRSLRQSDKAATEAPIELSTIPELTMTYSPTTEPSPTIPNKLPKKPKKKPSEKRQRVKVAESRKIETTLTPINVDSSSRGKFKYGDRLNERYDYEYDDLLFI